MKPIYEPKGRAQEYCDLAINIYTGCNHGCVYCYAPRVLHKTQKQFAAVEPRNGLVDALKKQLVTEGIRDREIQLCFTCDPYPADIDTSVTREVIEIIKNSGNHVRILTKGGNRALRDFDLLDGGDWFGVTLTEYSRWIKENEPNTGTPYERLNSLLRASESGIKTWASFEPVYNPSYVFAMIRDIDFIDIFKIGKLNYAPSDIDWGEFGRECERLCVEHGRSYYIKDDLRKAMEVQP